MTKELENLARILRDPLSGLTWENRTAAASAIDNLLTARAEASAAVKVDVDELAQEIRRVDGNHSLGAGALAEALMPFLTTRPAAPRSCTCHPDDNPPVPCAEKYAYSECAAAPQEAEAVAGMAAGDHERPLDWAVGRWNVEVANRPLRNVHRAALDTAWRQVIRHFGGDAEALCGPDHYTLIEQNPEAAASPPTQEVTEAQVEAAVQAIRPYTRETLLIDEHRELVRNALAAAQEAGR